MVKKYPTSTEDTNQAVANIPSTALINQLLNYSKSIEVKKLKQQKVMLHMN
ncbi:MAG: hypothetical protein KA734_11595 [Fluviicola sp.]|nr:hypothetical protein [Fluviicola sp.]MBP6271972.1 hypothetical protein [Fluviicola sp.]